MQQTPKGENAKSTEPSGKHSLGGYLASLRSLRKLTLREVEEATDKEISNAYLSQLETNKITKPSPSVLHALATVYAVPYEILMEKAGYLPRTSSSPPAQVLRSAISRHGRVPTFAEENVTQEEEEHLLEYLAFLRSRRGKGGKT